MIPLIVWIVSLEYLQLLHLVLRRGMYRLMRERNRIVHHNYKDHREIKKHVDRFTYSGYTAKHYVYMTNVMSYKEPTSFAEEVKDENWCEAMDEEYDALLENRIWDLVKLPEGKMSIGCKWVYKVKFKSNGSLER